VQDRHGDLLAADPVHLFSDDGVDLVHHSLSQRQVDVDPGCQLADQPCPDHQPVADRFGLGRIFFQGWDQ